VTNCHESLHCPVKNSPCPEVVDNGCPLADRCALLALVEVERARFCARCKRSCPQTVANLSRGDRAAKRLAACPDLRIEAR